MRNGQTRFTARRTRFGHLPIASRQQITKSFRSNYKLLYHLYILLILLEVLELFMFLIIVLPLHAQAWDELLSQGGANNVVQGAIRLQQAIMYKAFEICQGLILVIVSGHMSMF
jgi:hypothetical protein